ncbi:MAG: hypothetical protein QM756_45485 [Polyangiaceae bacterium]
MRLWDAAATPRPGFNDSETLRPSNIEVPPPSLRAPSSNWPKWAAAAAVFVLVGAAVAKFNAKRQAAAPSPAKPVAVAAAPKPEVVAPPPQVAVEPAPAPAPAQPEPTPASSQAAAPPPAAPAPQLADAFAAALSATPGMIEVAVNVTPKGAVVFDHGKRIGTDLVHVNVEPGRSKNLVALLDGYEPRKFSVESTDTLVNINLKPALPGSVVAPAAAPIAAPPAAAPAAGAAVPAKAAAAPAKPKSSKAFDPSADVGSL